MKNDFNGTTARKRNQSKYSNYREVLESIKNVNHSDAFALPGSFYSDSEFLEIEQEQLFAQQWVCVGRVEEVPEPGDYLTYNLAGEPVVIVRGQDGIIRAISNVCRHRGTVLMEGSGNSQRFVCPYHHWVYATDGKLLNAPGIESRDNFDISHCRLPQFNCESWHGFLFVSLSADAGDLHQQLSALDDIVVDYHLEQMQLRYLHHETWPINWKSLMENFMEGYHLSPLHRDTLHKVNPTRLCRHLEPGESWFGYAVGFADRVPEDRIGHSDLSDEQFDTCVMYAVPPGLAVGVGCDYSSFLCIRPVAADSVEIKMGLLFYGDTWKEKEVDNAVTLFQETLAEDKEVLLKVEPGLRSRYYSPGPLAPPSMEGTLLDLQKYLARSINLDSE